MLGVVAALGIQFRPVKNKNKETFGLHLFFFFVSEIKQVIKITPFNNPL